MLRKERPETKIIVCEPEDAATLSSGIRQQGNPDGPAAASHPAWHPNVMQGWNPDLLAKLVEDAADMRLIDEVLLVSNADAISCSQELARKEGIFVGITSGATFSAALEVCAVAPQGSTMISMLPDTGERYLSTPLFADVLIEMNEEEQEIARSTANHWLQPA